MFKTTTNCIYKFFATTASTHPNIANADKGFEKIVVAREPSEKTSNMI